MIDCKYLASVMKKPVLLLRFEQDSDAGMAFCAEEDKEGNLAGLLLFYVRKSNGKVQRTKADVSSKIFKPILSRCSKSEHQFILKINPLTDPLTLKKAKDSSYFCEYPFKDQGKIGKITSIDVSANRFPLSVTFDINAVFRKTATESVPLKKTIKAPEEFTKELYEMFTSY